MQRRDDPVSKRLRMIFDTQLPRGQKPRPLPSWTLKSAPTIDFLDHDDGILGVHRLVLKLPSISAIFFH
jgi:hypothetical protein